MTDGGRPTDATAAFRQARDYLLAHREDYDTAYRDFRWPQLDTFNYATDWFDVLAAELSARSELIREDPEFLLQFLEPELTAPDRRILRDPAIRRLLTGTYAEALRQGPEGWIDDVLAFRQSWGFSLKAIEVPVLLWHGADDVFSPVAHTHWLASQIPGAEVEVQHGAAHFDAVEVLPRILARL